jgi:large subunit ribosomal protein L15
MRLHSLSPRPGARHRVKRLGCGESSGHGKTSGKGHKGQKARSGGSIRIGFEGGQMPLIRRLPKRGFNNAAFGTVYAPVNVGDLDSLEMDEVLDEAVLRKARLVTGKWDGVKILGSGQLSKKIRVRVHAISASARAKIEGAGGAVELIAAAPASPKPQPSSKQPKAKGQKPGS